MKIILTLVILVLVGTGWFEMHDKEMKCSPLGNTTLKEPVSDHAYIVNRISVGDTVSLVSFRNLNQGRKEDWSINPGYRRGDTIYSVYFDMGKRVHKPIYVADDVHFAVVVEK